jgi:hypothetical protein
MMSKEVRAHWITHLLLAALMPGEDKNLLVQQWDREGVERSVHSTQLSESLRLSDFL